MPLHPTLTFTGKSTIGRGEEATRLAIFPAGSSLAGNALTPYPAKRCAPWPGASRTFAPGAFPEPCARGGALAPDATWPRALGCGARSCLNSADGPPGTRFRSVTPQWLRRIGAVDGRRGTRTRPDARESRGTPQSRHWPATDRGPHGGATQTPPGARARFRGRPSRSRQPAFSARGRVLRGSFA